jgi:hypothetical protein
MRFRSSLNGYAEKLSFEITSLCIFTERNPCINKIKMWARVTERTYTPIYKVKWRWNGIKVYFFVDTIHTPIYILPSFQSSYHFIHKCAAETRLVTKDVTLYSISKDVGPQLYDECFEINILKVLLAKLYTPDKKLSLCMSLLREEGDLLYLLRKLIHCHLSGVSRIFPNFHNYNYDELRILKLRRDTNTDKRSIILSFLHALRIFHRTNFFSNLISDKIPPLKKTSASENYIFLPLQKLSEKIVGCPT